MLRRILSPRQPQEGSKPKAQGGQFVDTKPRSQSSSALHYNGHVEEGEEVKNLSYGDPDTFHAPVRTQSMVTTPTREMNPPLPPRNLRPPESSVYVTPADTLRNRPNANSSPHPSAGSSASSNEISSAAVDPEAQPTKSERRVMQMHQLTMNQRRGGAVTTPATAAKPSNGHKRTGSIGTVTERSDYSVPFDLKSEPPRAVRPPVKPPRVAPPTRHESSDCIIPINPPSSTSPQPPSDRSDTNSPSSPMSNQSSEHEQPRQDDGDYAVPWDRNKLFQNIRVRRAPQGRNFRNDDSGFSEDATHRLQGDREFVQLRTEEQKPPSKEYSPPPPARGGLRYQSARGVEVSPPPPELPYDPRPHRNRGMSDRVPHRDGSTSPVGVSRGEFHSQSASYMGRNPPAPPSRLDPSQERGWGDSSPLPPPRDHSVREDMKGQVMIDVSIPLKDQPWYHGHVTRAEAEDILRDRPDFSFLVRKSESCQTDYSLSIRDTSPTSAAGYYHLRLVFEKDPPGYVLGQFSSHFEKVTECIAFYTKQRLNIRGAEHKRLRFPIPRAAPIDRGQGHLTTIGV